MPSNEEKGFASAYINWLACIYGDYHSNHYKMGIFKKWDLASFNKKKKKNLKKQIKIYLFLRAIRVLACNVPTHFIFIKRGEKYEWIRRIFKTRCF